jgi:hypothetical protein
VACLTVACPDRGIVPGLGRTTQPGLMGFAASAARMLRWAPAGRTLVPHPTASQPKVMDLLNAWDDLHAERDTECPGRTGSGPPRSGGPSVDPRRRSGSTVPVVDNDRSGRSTDHAARCPRIKSVSSSLQQGDLDPILSSGLGRLPSRGPLEHSRSCREAPGFKPTPLRGKQQVCPMVILTWKSNGFAHPHRREWAQWASLRSKTRDIFAPTNCKKLSDWNPNSLPSMRRSASHWKQMGMDSVETSPAGSRSIAIFTRINKATEGLCVGAHHPQPTAREAVAFLLGKIANCVSTPGIGCRSPTLVAQRLLLNH